MEKRNIKHFRGFTLIELLVVVLIIGILAAVAVSQYRFAVDKSIISTYLPLVQSIIKAKRVYYLANGTWSGDLTALDIDASKVCPTLTGNSHNELGSCKPGNVGIDTGSAHDAIILRYCTVKSCGSWTNQNNLHLWASFSSANGSISVCIGYDARGQKLCKWLKPD